MSVSLESFMQELAAATHAVLRVDQRIYQIEISTASGRRQVIRAITRKSDTEGDIVLFYTPVGSVGDDFDWRSLLELNVGTVYARAGILDDQVVVIAGQRLDHPDLSETVFMLTEVATLGDTLERIFFGQDQF